MDLPVGAGRGRAGAIGRECRRGLGRYRCQAAGVAERLADHGNIEETVENREDQEASAACAPLPRHKRGADQHVEESAEEEQDLEAEPRGPD